MEKYRFVMDYDYDLYLLPISKLERFIELNRLVEDGYGTPTFDPMEVLEKEFKDYLFVGELEDWTFEAPKRDNKGNEIKKRIGRRGV